MQPSVSIKARNLLKELQEKSEGIVYRDVPIESKKPINYYYIDKESQKKVVIGKRTNNKKDIMKLVPLYELIDNHLLINLGERYKVSK